ncbi:MAG: hypothetical protein IJ034_00885, partial [Mailhella sp.]|nr:hypothetical protein [Mailhella sp.]
MRALDIRLKAQAEDMARKTAACQKARISLEQATAEAEALEKKLLQSVQQKKESSAWLAEHAGDAALPQHIAAMRTTFAMMAQREERQEERANTLQDRQKELEEQTQALEEGRSAYGILAEEQGKL